MYENGSESAQARPHSARRPTRLIWVFAMCAAAAVSFGPGVAHTLSSNGSISVNATPEDPCLMTQTCGEETHIAIEQMQGDELAAECDRLHLAGLPIPPVCDGIQP